MDLYETLGIAKDATKAEIKKAYRKLARKLHPDREGGDKEAFQEVQHAYMVLYDDRARADYDRTGEDGHRTKPTATQMAYENLAGLFTAILTENVDNIHRIDIFKFMREKVTSARREPERLKKKAEKAIAQYAKVTKKLKRKNRRSRKPKIMENVIAEQTRLEKGKVTSFKEDITMYNLMLELMDDYDYDFDAPNATDRAAMDRDAIERVISRM